MVIFTVIAVFTCVFYWLFYAVYSLEQTAIYIENGPLENIQVVTLILSCISFLLASACKEREAKLITLFFSLLCLAFLLREVDVERLNVPHILIFFGSGTGRNIMLTIGLLAISAYASLNIRYYKEATTKFLASLEGFLIIAAAILLITGNIFESSTSIPHHVFLEEAFELSAYVAILLAALIPLQKPACYSQTASD